MLFALCSRAVPRGAAPISDTTDTRGVRYEDANAPGPVHRPAARPVQRREPAREGLAEDGQGGDVLGAAQRLRGAPRADPPPRGAPGTDFREAGCAGQGQEVLRHAGAHRGGGGPDRRGARGRRAGRRPDRRGPEGGALRDRRLRHRLHLGRDARPARGPRMPQAHPGRGEGHRRETDSPGREPNQQGRPRRDPPKMAT